MLAQAVEAEVAASRPRDRSGFPELVLVTWPSSPDGRRSYLAERSETQRTIELRPAISDDVRPIVTALPAIGYK